MAAKVAVALGIGAAVAVVLFTVARANEAAQTDLELTTRAAAHVSALEVVIERDAEVLEAIGSLIEISSDLDRAGFEKFTRKFLSDHSEIQALAWIPRVAAADRISYESAASDRFKQFQFTQRDNDGRLVEAAQNDEYFPVYFIQPLASNLTTPGFDLSSDPIRKFLLEKSRDSGSILASAPMTLIENPSFTREFLIVSPVYAGGVRPHSLEEQRNLLAGFSLGVFRIDEMIANAFAPFDVSPVEYRLDDVSFARSPIVSSTGSTRITSPGAGNGSPVATAEISVFGRTWSLNTALPADTVSEIRTSVPWVVFVGALIITLGVVAYLLRQHRHHLRETRARAVERSRVLALNAELKDSVLNRDAEVDVLDQELNQAIRELSTLADIGRAVSDQTELDGVYAEIAHALPRLVEYDRLEISLYNGTEDNLTLEYVDGRSLASDGIDGRTPSERISNGRRDLTPHIERATHYNALTPIWDERRNAGLNTWIGVPMMTGNSRVGVIKIGSRKRNAYGGRDLERLGRVAAHIAPATRQAMLQAELRKQATDLEKSNADLEQFAYIASHDLQEPLRMISGFTQLLQKKYSAELDDTANEYIARAVDGAQRMRELINSLLQYSRVQSTGGDFIETDLNDIVREVSESLDAVARESGAEITRTSLPTIIGDSIQIKHVFQNLIHNAFKYRREGVAPRVNISWSETADEWLFTVRDNGIGIEPKYFNRIFDIFQRLHTQDEYSGTGIGLALVRRIVERHDGRVWVESSPGVGTSMHFTISKKLEVQYDHADE